MILAYLILAHLLGDFVFQPTRLVLWKMRSIIGVLVHILVHFAIIFLILLPLIINGYPWLILVILAITLMHFLIDQAKISYDLRHDKKVKPFIIDQLLHLLTILFVYFFIRNTSISLPETTFYDYYTDVRIIYFIALIVLATTFIEIYRFQRKREERKNPKFKLNKMSMLRRFFVFILIYLLFTFIAIYSSGRGLI